MLMIATEDELSERVACKIAMEASVKGEDIECVGRKGSGYLRRKIGDFAQVARRRPVLVLTDLDDVKCAPSLCRQWMGETMRERSVLFRVAVREIEAWLLADRKAMAMFLGVSSAKIVKDTQTIGDPKRYLLNLAKFAPASLKADLLPRPGVRAAQGFGYNSRLGAFVESDWCSKRACENNSSLRKTVVRLKAYLADFDSRTYRPKESRT